MGGLCHSARFIPAFAQVLSTYESFAPEALDRLKAIDPACRIPATVANDLAVHQVAVTGDLDLGLKAARAMALGRAGPLDYAIRSAPTVRESVAVANRYIRAYSDVLDVRLDPQDCRAVLTLEMRVPAPRPILDFDDGRLVRKSYTSAARRRARARVLVFAPAPLEDNRIRAGLRGCLSAIRGPRLRIRVRR